MSTSAPTGRNDPCPCGSGQKYKLCCEGRQDLVGEARKSPWLIGGAAVVGLGLVATIAMQLGDPKPSDSSQSMPGPRTTQSPIGDPAALLAPLVPPEGGSTGAPPGKVWSAEHGHYHDIAPAPGSPTAFAPNGSPIGSPNAAPGTLVPEPAEPAPAGKVWSPEHGHYHDIAAAGATPGTISPSELTPIPPPTGTPGALTPEPAGPAPEGKVWSAEHGHYHDAPGATPVVPAPQPVDPPAPPAGTPPK